MRAAYIVYRIALCLHLEIYLMLSMIILNETIRAEVSKPCSSSSRLAEYEEARRLPRALRRRRDDRHRV
jgi:hypothetical protein